ncbi:flagella synthesis protein FlgN [Pseudomonas sp. OIL-1]|uniref:flagella synthesis protein FlgN n=1 Tax=Pseudomonas sp. OIL-1 TaxID=2706126 RepID=UPI0013A725FD|nr:flagellar protein FlgN [Pseudomonas sp. OIL-1]QIB51613.1 flagellar protein FlgN [Pseudomonas sp. OIL-1]
MTLKQLFDQAVSDCEQFVELLDREQQALIQNDMVTLESLLTSKAPLVSALNSHDQQINDQARQLGKIPEQTMEAFLEPLGQMELIESYQSLRQHLTRCRDANLRNARLVRHSQHANSHLLDLLRNQGESSQAVYDRQGLATRSHSQRPIIKA